MQYFSEIELEAPSRNIEYISDNIWNNIAVYMGDLIKNGWFGNEFPDKHNCPDNGVTGVDKCSMFSRASLEIPSIGQDLQSIDEIVKVSSDIARLDLIQFCFRYVSKPYTKRHDYPRPGHNDLTFSDLEGKTIFVDDINKFFSRNGIAYELKNNGKIERLLNPVLQIALKQAYFNTGDTELNEMLGVAREKFINPNINVRKEALDKLWGAFERIKTVCDGKHKKEQLANLLNKVSSCPEFREKLDGEMKDLTSIGNNFIIRHTETNKIKISNSNHIDYLFHRMFSLIMLFNKTLKH